MPATPLSVAPPPPRWTVVTPAVAAKWLEERNTHNRPLDRATAEGYARDMRAGRWTRNAETIKFGMEANGSIVIVDGQHRLEAVRLAGVPVEFLIAYGIPLDFQKTVDRGRHRSFSDTLSLAGESNYPTLSALARRGALWEAGFYLSSSAKIKLTDGELDDFLLRHPEARRSAKYGDANTRSAKIRASLLGFSHYLLTSVAGQDGEVFLDRVADGVGLTAKSPIKALRDRIDTEADTYHRTGRRTSPDTYVAFVNIAWNAYRKGKDLQKIQLPPGGLTNDNFPRPRR